ncbi:GTP-binding GTPase N-terminal domain-containing protein [Forsythia ovata]|uniref:GTP-binding GTPase N-terminal domain-containing protein n=1 Tax=Forsythia ovata TaxID=205694 RepID=A0ABD1P165_9LAMI
MGKSSRLYPIRFGFDSGKGLKCLELKIDILSSSSHLDNINVGLFIRMELEFCTSDYTDEERNAAFAVHELASIRLEDEVFQEETQKARSQNLLEKKPNVEEKYYVVNGERAIHVLEEKAYLVGIARKSDADDSFGIEKSFSELAQLSDTAGLLFVGSTYQKLAMPNPRTEIGSGKVAEIKSAIHEFDVETFDKSNNYSRVVYGTRDVILLEFLLSRSILQTQNAKRGGYAIGAFNVYNSVGIEELVAAAAEE